MAAVDIISELRLRMKTAAWNMGSLCSEESEEMIHGS